MNLTITVTTAADAQAAAVALSVLAVALGGTPAVAQTEDVAPETDTAAPAAPAKRGPGRPRKAADPVEQYQAAGGTLPPAPGPVDPILTSPPVLVPAAAAAIVASEAPAAPARSRDELLGVLRAFAQSPNGGALWLRGVLQACKVDRLSALSDDDLAHQAAACEALA